MLFYSADQGAYQEAYFATIDRAELELGGEIASVISAPEARAISKDYLEAKRRIVVMGQETSENYQPMGQKYECWARQIGGMIAFDYAYPCPKTARSAFWRAMTEIQDAFGLPTRRHLAWSNICKVQRLQCSKGRSVSINNIRDLFDDGPEVRLKIVKWQAALVRAELSYLRPHGIIMLTGQMSWIGKHTFPAYAEKTVICDDSSFKVVTWDGCDFPVVQTYHPQAHPAGVNVAAIRRSAIEYLLSELG